MNSWSHRHALEWECQWQWLPMRAFSEHALPGRSRIKMSLLFVRWSLPKKCFWNVGPIFKKCDPTYSAFLNPTFSAIHKMWWIWGLVVFPLHPLAYSSHTNSHAHTRRHILEQKEHTFNVFKVCVHQIKKGRSTLQIVSCTPLLSSFRKTSSTHQIQKIIEVLCVGFIVVLIVLEDSAWWRSTDDMRTYAMCVRTCPES